MDREVRRKVRLGYEKLRDVIFANQKKLGVIPGKPSPPRCLLNCRSGTRSPLGKETLCTPGGVFAGDAASTDYEIGRVIQAVEDMGKLDPTLIILCGDTASAPEGTLYDVFQSVHRLQRLLKAPEVLQMLHLENWGSDKTYPHMAVGWALAFDTPFQWTKQVGIAFRRDPAGPGDFMARSHQGRRRHPLAVPPCH